MSRRRILDDQIIITSTSNAPAMTVLWNKGCDRSHNFSASEARSKTDSYFNSLFKNNTNLITFDEWEHFTGLTNVNFRSSGGGAFRAATNLKHVKIPRSIIDLGCETFKGCSSLEYINIPSNVKYLGRNNVNNYSDGIFNNCTSLTSVYLPDNILECSSAIFAGCNKLETVRWSSNLPVYFSTGFTYSYSGCFDGCSKLSSIQNFPTLTQVPYGIFKGCKLLDIVDLLEDCWSTITRIAGCAFYNCDLQGKNVVLPIITTLGAEAFKGCTNVNIIELGDTLNSTGNYSFSCSSTGGTSNSAFIFRKTTPISYVTGMFSYNTFPIYVPYSSEVQLQREDSA